MIKNNHVGFLYVKAARNINAILIRVMNDNAILILCKCILTNATIGVMIMSCHKNSLFVAILRNVCRVAVAPSLYF